MSVNTVGRSLVAIAAFAISVAFPIHAQTAAEPGFPAKSVYPVASDIKIAQAFPTNNLGPQSNQSLPSYVVSPEVGVGSGWLPCANRLHLTDPQGTVWFVMDPGQATRKAGLWIAHNFHVPTKQQTIWLWNANPDSGGGLNDERWAYTLVTGYFRPAADGSSDDIIKRCKHAATEAALSGGMPYPGETVGPAGDDDNPFVY